ncbi:hypothetical protein PROFUN_09094 [Planoprotostelium fungivorum]|uniref:Uncharacterized protein n=1 Tax=Planoprotostelium fungivorum TaxID=1890364 RepID=A0A2P6NIJ9_9EUKA|nr:hypothetical protein PROFUN_09094 [Planoprotostelium fungivorum]
MNAYRCFAEDHQTEHRRLDRNHCTLKDSSLCLTEAEANEGLWFLRFLLDVVTRVVLALKSATRSGLLDRLSSAYKILGLPISLSYIQDRLNLVLLFTVNYDRRWSWSLSTYQCVLHVRREK